ncbi:Hsp20 family protein [Roseicella aerolata]|uniref:Hsp20 family protein n=1 Tax=Roseicella aerolata TaxID=2883479 RepID=A0A9X1LD29_9PROT|nr:Hsp20 family protein [Roseicella aerolata]MCB4824815.1 Hsp20 family protein [Roseicella aerolata]
MIDFAPLSRFTVGFDRLFDMLDDQAFDLEPDDPLPHYDIERIGEDAYRITLAVPGFRPDDISVESQPNLLLVTGRAPRDQGGEYLHHGLPLRSFERRFTLADFVEVTGASLADGLLTIGLKRELPEAMRPRRIEIAGGAAQRPRQIEGQQAA